MLCRWIGTDAEHAVIHFHFGSVPGAFHLLELIAGEVIVLQQLEKDRRSLFRGTRCNIGPGLEPATFGRGGVSWHGASEGGILVEVDCRWLVAYADVCWSHAL